jgi:Na+/melibiose symporter-like transporter
LSYFRWSIFPNHFPDEIFLQKIGLGLALSTSSYALGWAGYKAPYQQQEFDEEHDSHEHFQPEAVLITLRWVYSFFKMLKFTFVFRLMLGLIPAVLLISTLPCLYFYPITKEKHKEILANIRASKETIAH